MAKFFGLRGQALHRAMIWAVIMPAYILFGYNNAGTVVALYTLGCFLGALSCIRIGDTLGRKRTIMLGAAINMVGAILQSSSYSLGQLIVGRLISGLGFEEAREVVSALDDMPIDSAQVQADIAEIEEGLVITGKGSFCDIFRMGNERLFHRTCLAVCGQMFQQLSGINALAFYQATIFETGLGLSAQTAPFIFMFSLFFPTGFLGLTFLYASEVSPLSVRVPITAMSTGSAWIFNFIVAEITPVGFTTIGWRYYIIYACINFFLILPGVYFFFPETNGRHLEEVDQIFLRSKTIFDAVRVSNCMPRGSVSSTSTGEVEKNEVIHVEMREQTI
ncbi:hypothetical protein SS1G_14264 [Sclerotinia sclerotiorum 1980 UF-70]|uniref:Major facilitator superfamily (MFS) profile domain-containing protein n=1 Tax=Sclerotinia sclerotiorum (strain ATCC 18683 / 1980 / Ss-1) TaxID=665079 RepID=A7F9I3_SCLS1|nr:hypothetical protein SS1G_14264 [Sclerotinia sclerotiorum 1980 UF-70]EDO00394.1 hypothetical protein SS1G_14264 [Sclerotinia sclerotiorum 1980 UF-70]